MAPRPMPRTGRLYKADDRDKDFLLPPIDASGIVRRRWRVPHVLDQGDTNQCVIYACDRFLAADPVNNRAFRNARNSEKTYGEVQALDEWHPEPHEGTSVRAMMKWLHKHGLVGEYRWAPDAATAIDYIAACGPMELGTIWDDGLSNPDNENYIFSNTDDADDTGHAWLANGIDREGVHKRTGEIGFVEMVQSWGYGWGVRGRAKLTFREFDKLIRMQGEACVAKELKVAGVDLTKLGVIPATMIA